MMANTRISRASSPAGHASALRFAAVACLVTFLSLPMTAHGALVRVFQDDALGTDGTAFGPVSASLNLIPANTASANAATGELKVKVTDNGIDGNQLTGEASVDRLQLINTTAGFIDIPAGALRLDIQGTYSILGLPEGGFGSIFVTGNMLITGGGPTQVWGFTHGVGKTITNANPVSSSVFDSGSGTVPNTVNANELDISFVSDAFTLAPTPGGVLELSFALLMFAIVDDGIASADFSQTATLSLVLPDGVNPGDITTDLPPGTNVSWITTAGQMPVVPVPAAAWMFLTALGGLGVLGWRRRRATA